MNAVLTFLSENWGRLELQRFGGTSDLSSIIVTPRFKASSHLLFFIYSKVQQKPILVVKVPRIPGDNSRLEREVYNLRWLQDARADGFDSIPRVVAFEDYADNRLLVETAMTYDTMRPAIVRRFRDACIKAVFEWLLDLERVTRSQTGESDRKRQQRLILEPLKYFETTFPCSGSERKLISDTRRIVLPLLEEDWPFVCEHGDLSSPNILISKKQDKIGVVDWELAEPHGLPATDLFFFLTYIAFAQARARSNDEYIEAFHEAYFVDNPWTQPHIERYRAEMQLPQKSLKPLFVLCWSRYVSSLVKRLKAYEDENGKLSKQTADWLRSNRYFLLWNHAVQHLEEISFTKTYRSLKPLKTYAA